MKFGLFFAVTVLAALSLSTSSVEAKPPHLSRRTVNSAEARGPELSRRVVPTAAARGAELSRRVVPTPEAKAPHLSRRMDPTPEAKAPHISRRMDPSPEAKAPYLSRRDVINTVEAYTVTSTVTTTVTVAPTGCAPSCETPTSVSTLVGQIQPPIPTSSPDYVPGLTFGVGWGHIGCETYCYSTCGEDLPFCDPSCSNKGACGFSNSTNLYLGGLADPANTQYTISATSPAQSFTIPLIYLTAAKADFISAYPHINFDVRSWDKHGNPLATQSFIIPRPPGSSYHTDIRLDLLALGIADVSKLEFFPWHEGSIGTGGQGPDGRVMASLRIDGDGLGGPINYQVFTPEC